MTLKWGGSVEAQRQADAAYRRLRPKKKLPKRVKSRIRRRKKAGRADVKEYYGSYINSFQWRKKRKIALRIAKYRCAVCGSKDDLQVHHKTYIRLGHEKMSDLVVLCRHCHEDQHSDKILPTDKISVEFRSLVSSF